MRRIRRRLLLAAFLGSPVLFMGCGGTTASSGGGSAEAPAVTANVNIGLPLYSKAAMPTLPATAATKDPLVIANAIVSYGETQTVPAQVDGYIDFVAILLPPGATYNKNDDRFKVHSRDPNPSQPSRIFQKIIEGDRVKAGQVVSWLDEQQVEIQYQSASLMIKNSDEQIAACMESLKQIDKILELQKRAGDALAPKETAEMEISKSRFKENEIQARQTKIKSMMEKDTSETMLRKHRPTAAVTGMVKKIYKNTGDFVKVGEPIMQIQRTDVVIVEGYVPTQYAAGIRPGTPVLIEPSRPVSEDRDLGSVSHRREVTGVAVTGHKGRPQILSSGLDNTVYVWDAFSTKATTRLAHTVGVKAIACTGPLAKTQFVVSGGEDGKIRVWDLNNPDKLPKEPKVLDEAHVAGITALAVSPDGRYLASAAGRDVYIWDLTTGKKSYTLPAELKDTVTMLRFTPQATLVTASRDKTLRVWNLGADGASVAMPLDHRAGVVDFLGVSSDGSRVLFDQDDGRIDVVGLADGRTVGTLQTAGAGRTTGASRFSTLAIFSSDDSLILTAGGEGARAELTLWETPKPGGRGMEQRKLVTPTEAEVTCAVFSPDREKTFLVVGTKTGGVHVWTPPAQAERTKVRTGVVETVMPFDDKTSQVRVRAVNVGDEQGDGMADRSKAKIIIPPDAVPTPAVGATRVPPATIVPVGGVLLPGGRN